MSTAAAIAPAAVVIEGAAAIAVAVVIEEAAAATAAERIRGDGAERRVSDRCALCARPISTGASPVRGFALAPCTAHPPARGRIRALVGVFALALLASGCNQEAKTEPPQPRPVRTVTVEKGAIGDAVQLTGDIRAENEVNLAFRIGGRIIERKGGVGDKVEPDQVLAKLDPQDELNGVRSAQAALNAARGQEVEAQNNFDRQNHLMERGFTTRAIFDSANQALQTAQARVDDANAQLDIAQDRLSFTELRANVSGTITARSAEAGEVVQPGQSIFTVARQDGRDAVFDVPAQVLRAAPADAVITIALADDPP